MDERPAGNVADPVLATKRRTRAAFQDGVARIREYLDGFEPHTMDPVVTIAP